MDLNSLIGQLVPAGFGLGGSIIGTALGGPFGTGIGGVLGKKAGEWLNDYTGNAPKQEMQPFSGTNQNFYNQLQSAQSNLLSQLQQQPQFQSVNINPYLQGARQEFNEQIVPGIAERFSGANAQRSSGFRNALGAAGSGLAQKLAELQTSHARDQQSQMMQNRGQNLQQLGLLGNFVNQQNQLGQQQNQFNQQQKQQSWDPYINAFNSIYGATSSNANRRLQGMQGMQQGISNAQNIGLGQQYQTQYNPAQPGALDYLAPIVTGGVKVLAGR